MAEEGEKIWHYLLQSEDLQTAVIELIYTDNFDPSEFDWARVNETIADKVKTEFDLDGERIPWKDPPPPDFYKEVLGEITREEAEGIVKHLRWVEKFADLMGDLFEFEPKDTAADLGDRLEQLLMRARQRKGIDALQRGQCDAFIGDGVQCDGVKGHTGTHTSPFPESS